MMLASFMRSKQWPRLSSPESVVNRGDPAVWVCSKDLCGADDGDVVRQKKPILHKGPHEGIRVALMWAASS